MRALKFLIGLGLLPVCYATARTLADLLLVLHPGSLRMIPGTTWALVGGFLFWLAFWVLTPLPVRTYVLGHELTHALWGALLGARVSRLSVTRRGGSVQLSKTNFLITLAPYFFPFYTFVVLLAYGGMALFFDQRHYEPFWAALIGFTWGFHLTFTVTALGQHQTDIQDTGPLFSYAVILLFNLLGLCLALVLVAPPTLDDLDAGLRRHLTPLTHLAHPAAGQ
jgi:hypothetical protein